MGPPVLKETHISWLVLLDERAYKIKKPVSFDFLDWSTREAREDACEMEVELNRRLSPDVYLGVGHFTSPDGAVEPVVVMRRMPEETSLSALLGVGDPSLPAHVSAVASVLAGFHARALRGKEVDRDSGPRHVAEVWDRNLSELSSIIPSSVPVDPLREVRRLGDRYLRGRRRLIEERVAAGRAVDGHGDLLCDDIFCTPDGLRILDCLEFDPALRHGDVAADVASLTMDLEHHGRADLAGLLVAEYQRRAGDAWPPSLTHFWVAHRALVRAKVSYYRALGAGDREGLLADAGRLSAMALQHLLKGRVRLVLVGGLPGTGKSTLAGLLARGTGWRLMSTDAIRRDSAEPSSGHGPGAFAAGLYSPSRVDANYRELIRSAARAVEGGESVILDASWSRRSWRDAAAAMAHDGAADVVALRCSAPADLARERIINRALTGPGGSDATPEVAAAMAAHWEPWPEAAMIDTSVSPEDGVRRAIGLLDP